VESLKKNVLDRKQILINAANLKIRAIDGKVRQLAIQISGRGKSVIELVLQKINKQREILNLAFVTQINKRKQAVLNFKSTTSTSYFNALQKHEQVIIFRLEQIKNGLRKTQERSKHRKIILIAAIIIAVLIVIILVLLKS
jgi:hypothetical protein